MRNLFLSLVALGSATPVAAAPTKAACDIAARYSDAHRGVSVLVLQDGKPVCEAYRGGDRSTPHELWSGTKSFVGVIAAAAVQDGLLTLDESAANTLSEWQADPVKKTITLRQLLSMASGQPSQIGKPPTYRGSLDGALVSAPGTRFLYGPVPMQTFGEVLSRKLAAKRGSGDVLAYMRERILKPAGIEVASWRTGPDGNILLPQGLVLTAREWAKFGEFVRGGGVVKGKPIVDRATFAEMFRPSVANPSYGLTWWLPHPPRAPDPVTASTDIGRRASELPKDLVVAAGFGDQRLYVIPSLKLTIVRQATLDLASLGKPSGWSDTDFLKPLLAP